MSLLVPDVGEVEILSRALNKIATGDVKVKLYTNDYTPVEGSAVGNFTECVAAGYGAKTLTGASWNVATVAGTTEASYAEQTFTLTAAAAIYGYYVTNSAGTTLLWAERFSSAPFNIPSGGGSVKVTPKFQGA